MMRMVFVWSLRVLRDHPSLWHYDRVEGVQELKCMTMTNMNDGVASFS